MKMQNCEVNRGMGDAWVKYVDEVVRISVISWWNNGKTHITEVGRWEK